MKRATLKIIGFSKTDEFSIKNNQFNQNFIYFHHLWSKIESRMQSLPIFFFLMSTIKKNFYKPIFF